MKKYLLLIALLIILSGCAVGIHDRHGFHGAAIGVGYPHYEPYYPDSFYLGYYYKHAPKHYSYEPRRYHRVPAYPGHYYR